MNPEQMRMMQQMQGGQQPQPMPPQMPKQQMRSVGKQVPWYDRFGWWTVAGLIIVGCLVALVFLPPLK
jgi:hypothetical protein